MGENEITPALPSFPEPTPTASISDERLLLAFLEDHDMSCLVCGYNLRGLAVPRCPECGTALTQCAGLSILPFHLGRRAIRVHVRCSGCGHDLEGLEAEWFRPSKRPLRLRWTVVCPQCSLRRDAPNPPRIMEGMPLRLGRRAVLKHHYCLVCGHDLVGLLAEWFRDSGPPPRVCWTVVCPECGSRQYAPDPPNAAVLDVPLWQNASDLAVPHHAP